jgi:hypothetical protein
LRPGRRAKAWLTDARRKYDTARAVGDADPETAYVTAYDAARFALVGVLAHQGLRATQNGGHIAVEAAVRAQFGDAFVAFAALRRRRAELEYPSYPGERVGGDELLDALGAALRIIDGAEQLLSHLAIFSGGP